MKTDNELIAEFMGVIETKSSFDSYGHDIPCYYTDNGVYRTMTFTEPGKSFAAFCKARGYDKEWSWLMPVVEKIEITPIQDPSMDEGSTCNPNFQIHKRIVKIWYPFENYKPFISCVGESKIAAVYKGAIEFIKWYNQNKPLNSLTK